MAHFAKLGKGNVVETIVVVHNNDAPTEADGINFLKNLYKDESAVWKQTSYNTWENKHLLGGTPFRKNYATVGGMYDQARDAFLPIKRFDSWVLNETTYQWEAPVAMPSILTYEYEGEERFYDIFWNEDLHKSDRKKVKTQGWQGTKQTDFDEEQPDVYDWDGTAWVLVE